MLWWMSALPAGAPSRLWFTRGGLCGDPLSRRAPRKPCTFADVVAGFERVLEAFDDVDAEVGVVVVEVRFGALQNVSSLSGLGGPLVGGDGGVL